MSDNPQPSLIEDRDWTAGEEDVGVENLEEHGEEHERIDDEAVFEGDDATLGDTTHQSVSAEDSLTVPEAEEGDTAEERQIAVSPEGELLVATPTED